jgi:hypothetical protein
VCVLCAVGILRFSCSFLLRDGDKGLKSERETYRSATPPSVVSKCGKINSMGSCCSVAAPVAHRSNAASPLGGTIRSPHRRLSANGSSARRTSLHRQSSLSPKHASASAGCANGSRTVLLDAVDPQNGSHSTGALVSTPTLPEEKTVGNQIIVRSISDSGAGPGDFALSEPSPLTFRNLELHASMSSTAVIPLSLPLDEQYFHTHLQQNAICPAAGDASHEVAVDEVLSDADDCALPKVFSARHSGQSSVVSAQQIKAVFGAAEMDFGFDDIDDGEEPLPAFQPLQMPTHLWPVSS